jgi:hypothetical protein
MRPEVDIVRTQGLSRSAVTASRHVASPLARTLLEPEMPMHFTTRPLVFALGALTSLAAACTGDVGGARKPARGTAPTQDTGPCTKLEQDVVIRSAGDMAALPKTGCYDIYGKLTVQGQAITSLAGLHEINSVNELDLDHTGLAAIDTKRPLGVFGGKLTVTGNARLGSLAQLSFETAATGILFDENPVLTSLDPLGLTDPKLEEVDGDIAITGNTALTAVPLGNLTRLTGALTVSGNPALTSIDLGKLATTGPVEIADNARLGPLTGFAATEINGDLAVHHNAVLTSLGTMSALYRVTGNVMIDSNPALANLAAFTTSLRFIDQSLTITNNAQLTDLGALKHVSLVRAITITGNQNLVNCRALEVDRCTQHPTASVITSNKNISCTTQCN